MTPDRRRLVVLAVVVGLLVALFFVGVGCGVTRHDPPSAVDSWRSHLAGVDPAATVEPSELTTRGSCSVDVPGSRLLIGGSCVVHVAALGRFSLRARRLVLAPVAVGVAIATRVEDQQVTGTIDAGEVKKVGLGRGAQDISVTCAGAFSCLVGLPR